MAPRPASPPVTACAPEVLRLSDPAGVLTAVPYLVGFEPHASLVVLALRGPRAQVGLTLRVDLDGGSSAALTGEVARHIAANLRGAHPRAAIAVVYDDGPRPELVAALRSRLRGHGVRLLNVLRVTGGRWWSEDPCGDLSCCPPEGSPVPRPDQAGASPSVTLAAATLVADGRAVLADRATLEQQLDPDPRADHEAVRQAMLDPGSHDRATTLRRLRRAARAAAAGRRLSDVAIGRLAAGLRPIPVRDEVLSLVIDSDAASIRELFVQLVRRLPPPDDAQAAAMLAWVAHAEGSGALANVAVDRALAGLPEYGLARLVEAGLRGGLPPERLHEVARMLRSGEATAR